MILVSIIIVNYNGDKLLDDCLSSIELFTTGINYEIIIVDNNSTQGNVDTIVRKYKNTFLVKNDKNEGFSKANNIGLKYANGSYILFLNNDTIFLENSINKIIQFINKNDLGECIIGCKLFHKDNSEQLSVVDFFNLWNLIGENFFLYLIFKKSKLFNRFHFHYKQITEPIEADFMRGAFLICTASLVKKLDGFDQRFFFYGEETDLCYRAKKVGAKILFYPFTSIIHIGGATTSKNNWFKFKNANIAKIQFFQKHFSGIKFFLSILIHYFGIMLRIPIYFIMGIFKFDTLTFLKSFYYFRALFAYPKNNFK